MKPPISGSTSPKPRCERRPPFPPDECRVLARARWSADEVMRRWPRIVAHVICESLGYFTPSSAANNIACYLNGEENWCEYIYSCWKCKPLPQIRRAIQGRHSHSGYMSEYRNAIALVRHAVETGREPELASWF